MNFRLHLHRMHALSFVLTLSLSAVFPACVCAAESSSMQAPLSENTQAYRQALYELVNELTLSTEPGQTPDPLRQSGLRQINASLGQISNAQLSLLQSAHVPLEHILQATQQLRAQREQAPLQSNRTAAHDTPQSAVATPRPAATDPIEFPEPDPISACNNTSPAQAYSALIAFSTLEEVLAGAKWLCEQLEVGENGAAACTSIGVAAVLAGEVFEFDEFCLANIRSANGSALLQTQRNIGTHLNQFVDATTSSRASQDSLDALQLDITSANQQLLQLHTLLGQAFNRIEADVSLTVSSIALLIQRHNGLLTQIRDLQQRLQASQVDIEDAQLRLASLQQDHAEIRADTQSLIAQLNTLDQSLSAYDAELSQRLTRAQRDDIARVLSNPNLTVMRYLLPQSRSGALEEVREVLIRAILSAENLGIKTTIARNLLTQGDQAYSQQNYASAYAFFAQSYQSLNSTSLSPVLSEPRSP